MTNPHHRFALLATLTLASACGGGTETDCGTSSAGWGPSADTCSGATETPGAGAHQVLDQEEVATSARTAVADLEAEEEADGRELMVDIELEDAEGAPRDRDAIRALIVEQVRTMAADEPCALRGTIAGIYTATETPGAGDFRARAYRRADRLTAIGAGAYVDTPETGAGEFAGDWVNFEGRDGALAGTYDGAPDPDRLGRFQGEWAPADTAAIEGGNLAGVWHPLRGEERGLFVGYYSRCDLTPRH